MNIGIFYQILQRAGCAAQRSFRAALITLIVLLTSSVFALDHIEFRYRGDLRQESGRIILEAEDGLAFEARDGQYFIIAPESLVSRSSDEEPFTPFSRRELLSRLEKEFPSSQGFTVMEKEPFVIVYTTSRGFADWYGILLKKLYDGYFDFWKKQGIALKKPQYPMVVLLFSNFQAFSRYGQTDGFQPAPGKCAYYNKSTNRIAICDLSGMETHRSGDRDRASSRDIQSFLNRPEAAGNIATIIHEATHLVGFSSGMHPRFAPIPLWVCEGLAVFHEVPDQGKKAGWTIRPKPSPYRLRDLKAYLARNPQRPIETLLLTDAPLTDSRTAVDNYAMAWGLTYYLIQRRPKEYSAYLQRLMQKTIESEDSPEIRASDFQSCFGDDMEKLYKDCGEYLRRL